MPSTVTIIGEIREWQWLDGERAVIGKIYNDKRGLQKDGNNVVIREIKYKSLYSGIITRGYWLVKSSIISDGYFQMYEDQKK